MGMAVVKRTIAAAAAGAALAGLTVPLGAASVQDIAIQTFQFQPARLEVAAGSTVRWTNRDEIEHIVTAGTPERPTGVFRASLDGKGTTMNVVFTTPGDFQYFCDRHQSMRGEIVVK